MDEVRERGWRGVVGNTDELLFRPESLHEFAAQAPPTLASLFATIGEMAVATCELLGEERLAWLQSLPRIEQHGSITLVHARPGDLWRAPAADASDDDLASVYSPLDSAVIVYGHIHTPFIRSFRGRTVANSGSVGLPYDGDPRASYLLLDDGMPSIRRVDYELEKELKALALSSLPHSEWIARSLRSARPEMP